MHKKFKKVDDALFEITRVIQGRGFRFVYKNGESINNQRMLKRLRKLVIPPMWTDVLVSQWEDGHVQATGRDKKGRKQYIYHSEWEKYRQQKKFDKMIKFGQLLPHIRQRCEADIKLKGWPKEKLMALLVAVLDETGIRIGNQRYTKDNNTFGLTTLRRKHIESESDQMIFSFKGKSHQDRQVSIDDDELISHIKKVAEQPGYEIFRYQQPKGVWHNIDSEDVNQYINGLTGNQFSSKDFRTWAATRLAVELYPDALKQKADNPRKKMTNILLRNVADELGNTPTVCKDYYVHPIIMQSIDKGRLPNLDEFKHCPESSLSAPEQIVMDVLDS